MIESEHRDFRNTLNGKKIWGFRALLSEDGRYRFDVDTKNCNLAQLGILTLLHQKIGKVLEENVKEVGDSNGEKTFREDGVKEEEDGD